MRIHVSQSAATVSTLVTYGSHMTHIRATRVICHSLIFFLEKQFSQEQASEIQPKSYPQWGFNYLYNT